MNCGREEVGGATLVGPEASFQEMRASTESDSRYENCKDCKSAIQYMFSCLLLNFVFLLDYILLLFGSHKLDLKANEQNLAPSSSCEKGVLQ